MTRDETKAARKASLLVEKTAASRDSSRAEKWVVIMVDWTEVTKAENKVVA